MGRAPCCEKVGLKRGRWTAEEDEILTKYIQANGEGSWRSLPKNAGLLRCGKSCRLRWINYLRTDVKRGNISAEEEEIILNLHATVGNRWSLIAGHLPGRTDNEIKNYWNSHLSRKFHSLRRPSDEALPPPLVMDLAKASIAAKRRGGRTSRAAMKKNKRYNLTKAPKLLQKSQEGGLATGSVPMPPTPTSETEALSSAAVSWQEESLGNIILDPYPIEDRSSSKNQVSAIYEALDSGMSCLQGIIVGDELVDPTGAMPSCDRKENGAAVMNEERECGATARSEDLESVNMSSNGETGDGYPCSSSNSCIDEGNWDWDWDWDWNWDAVVQGNELCDEEEKMLNWLWGSDNGEGDRSELGSEISSEKEEAMIAWLLS